MKPPVLDIDLDRAPEDRWDGLAPYRLAARELMAHHMREIADPTQHADLLMSYAEAFLDPEYHAELRAIAGILDCSEPEILAWNLYYDAIKPAFGCSAFAVDTPDGPLHARNLDWPTNDGALARHTLVVRFLRGGEPHFLVVGWPGSTGCLSGIAPGRFAITLNAVLSNDSAEFRPPITYLLRSVLDEARDFDAALKALTETEVASDSLLLLTGTRNGEMAVIERSPLRAAVRGAEDGCIVVTNDYRVLDDSTGMRSGDLAETSCGRFDRATQLCASGSSFTSGKAFEVLDDDRVRMGITVQQMTLSARLGQLDVRIPTD